MNKYKLILFCYVIAVVSLFSLKLLAEDFQPTQNPYNVITGEFETQEVSPIESQLPSDQCVIGDQREQCNFTNKEELPGDLQDQIVDKPQEGKSKNSTCKTSLVSARNICLGSLSAENQQTLSTWASSLSTAQVAGNLKQACSAAKQINLVAANINSRFGISCANAIRKCQSNCSSDSSEYITCENLDQNAKLNSLQAVQNAQAYLQSANCVEAASGKAEQTFAPQKNEHFCLQFPSAPECQIKPAAPVQANTTVETQIQGDDTGIYKDLIGDNHQNYDYEGNIPTEKTTTINTVNAANGSFDDGQPTNLNTTGQVANGQVAKKQLEDKSQSNEARVDPFIRGGHAGKVDAMGTDSRMDNVDGNIDEQIKLIAKKAAQETLPSASKSTQSESKGDRKIASLTQKDFKSKKLEISREPTETKLTNQIIDDIQKEQSRKMVLKIASSITIFLCFIYFLYRMNESK